VLASKIGLVRREPGDGALAEDLLAHLASDGADDTVFFRQLSDAAADPALDEPLASGSRDPVGMHGWLGGWRTRLALEGRSPEESAAAMRLVNPAFIPRNHRVEEAIAAAVESGDFTPFRTLMQVLARPYDDQPEHAALAEPPTPDRRVTRTFCGT